VAFECQNRRGDVYRLQVKTTKSGKPRYYFGRKLTGEPVEKVPEGYEVFESPERGQVFLRKHLPSCIDPTERETVVDGIRQLSNVEHFIVTVEEDSLVVYLPTQSGSEASNLVETLAGPDALRVPRFREARDRLVRESQHHKAMRFQVLNERQRLFHVQRWCFRGSDGGWMHLHRPAPLSDLVERYAEHLGEDSFYELY
jgi:hypothetical protein